MTSSDSPEVDNIVNRANDSECDDEGNEGNAPVELSLQLKTDFLWKFVRSPDQTSTEIRNSILLGSVAPPKEKVVCLFCDKNFDASVDRICAHSCGAKGGGIEKCKGVSRKEAESETDFAQRKQPFNGARSRCQNHKKEKDEARERPFVLALCWTTQQWQRGNQFRVAGNVQETYSEPAERFPDPGGFIEAQNCEGKVKDKEFIAEFIATYIEEHARIPTKLPFILSS
eukprot:gene13513-15975_t